MRPQLDLRPSPVVLALGALGLAGTGAAAAGTPVAAQARGGAVSTGAAAATPVAAGAQGGAVSTGAAAATPVAASAQGGAVWLDGLAGAAGGPSAPLAPLLAPISGRGTRVWISAFTPRRDLLVGGAIAVSGRLRPAARADVVFVQERRGPGWATVARGVTGPAGRYRLAFRPAAPGSLTLRVGFAGDRVSPPAQARLGVVYVYRLAGASWYGPGGPLACGGTLTDDKLGVAHRTLPCGTLVRLRVGSRTVEVPVIDRGPYVAGRDYDLTPATKRALGFGDVGDVWVSR